MNEVCRRRGLGVEPLDVGLIGELAGEDHLQRHGAIEADLPRAEDDAHAAVGQLALDLRIAEVADAGRLGDIGRRDGSEVDCGLVAGRDGGLLVDRGIH